MKEMATYYYRFELESLKECRVFAIKYNEVFEVERLQLQAAYEAQNFYLRIAGD